MSVFYKILSLQKKQKKLENKESIISAKIIIIARPKKKVQNQSNLAALSVC